MSPVRGYAYEQAVKDVGLHAGMKSKWTFVFEEHMNGSGCRHVGSKIVREAHLSRENTEFLCFD